MTVSRKLFLAAVLVAVGFGVASLLGEPVLRTNAPHSGGPVLWKRLASAAPRAATVTSATPYRSEVRLVPDFGTEQTHDTDPPLVDVAPALLPSVNSASADSPISQYLVGVENAKALHKTHPTNIAPKAKLRNEAPRPLAIEPRLPATVERLPPTSPVNAESAEWRTAGLMPAGFAHGSESAPTISASYNQLSVSTTGDTTIAPPPWPPSVETDVPRTHVIVDGDSLAKLAGRYLDDPHRSGEIYELNRGVLTDPELLPIGTELAIPAQSGGPAFDGHSPQSFVPRAVAIHSATHGGLVPVRPVPSAAGVMPRAQLSRPRPSNSRSAEPRRTSDFASG